jgi:hypothetical protein
MAFTSTSHSAHECIEAPSMKSAVEEKFPRLPRKSTRHGKTL